MTNERSFFLQILSDHMQRQLTNPPEGLDWEQIAAYAKSHEVEAIVGYQCREYLTTKPELKDILARFETARAASMFYYTNRVQALEELKATYQKEHVRFFTVKGLDVAALYPVPAYRTMGDMDIVLSAEDRERVYGAMTRLGYTLRPGGYERHYARGGVKLELHDHLLYPENLENEDRKAYFNACWEHIAAEQDSCCRLDWNFHFLFLVEHLKQHFSANGVGFRQFMDMVIAARELPELDWTWIETELRKIGLWDFTVNAASICCRWWDIELPIPTIPLDDDFFEVSTELVFSNGVFGFDNEEYRTHETAKRLRSVRAPKILRPVIVAFRKVFLPYRQMVNYPNCSFLHGRRYLLPCAWIYRLYYIAVHRRRAYAAEGKLIFASGSIIQQHNDLMKQWGL